MDINWTAFGFSVLGGLVALFFQGVAGQLGKNVAELISSRKIEWLKALGRQPVDQENARHAAELAASTHLRFAAMEKRLQAHQEAYTWSRELWRAHYVHVQVQQGKQEFRGQTVLKAQKWWNENCVYLEPEVREAFKDAYLQVGLPEDVRNTHNYDVKIMNALTHLNDSIWKAVKLPPFAISSKLGEVDQQGVVSRSGSARH